MKNYKIKNYLNKNPFTHGIMFHHFHDNLKYKKQNASISINDFKKIIKLVGRKNIVDADVFLNSINKKSFKKKICLTFDDALQSQFNLILPELKKLKLKAFFFVYSEVMEPQKKNLLEPVRDFISNFESFDHFYEFFYTSLEQSFKNYNFKKFLVENNTKIKSLKKKYPFYSYNELRYRIIRDFFFRRSDFDHFMKQLFKKKKYNLNKRLKNLFMKKNDLTKLVKDGHLIGLHSHSHPHKIENLSLRNQKNEYVKNYKFLKRINKKFELKSMSHPTGSYNYYTFKILRDLGIKIGFTSNISNPKKNLNKKKYKNFLIRREDCKNILKYYKR